MERKTKWRLFWLGVIVVLSVCALVPSLVPSDRIPPWFSNVFSRKIQLGLDLQGGLHIVYGVDLDKAVDDKASEIKRDLDDKFSELGLAIEVKTPLTPVGGLTLSASNPADLANIKSHLTEYDEVLEPRQCRAAEAASSVCYRVSSDYADRIKESALEQAIKTIRERIDERGIAEPTVVRKGDDIIVELPGLDEESIERVKEIIRRTAKLEFKIVDNGSEYMQNLARHISTDPRAQELGIDFDTDVWVHDDTGNRFEDTVLLATDRTQFLAPDEARKYGCGFDANTAEREGKVECTISGRQVMEEYLEALSAEKPELAVNDNHQIGYEKISKRPDDTSPDRWRAVYLHRAVELAGTAVSQADVVFNPTTNRAEVLVTFNRFGARRFEELTGKNVGRKMAIILDDTINSAPVIQSRIGGGRSTITMGGTENEQIQREAEDLVNVLRTGSLPAPLREESSSVVGPLLGRDAVDKAKLSFTLGGGLVLLIMLFYYRTSGIISVLALGINLLTMMAIMAMFGATLTLPGIAAFVLTIGMAVDANIIIYERIRDELRAGKSVRGSVEAGFSHAFWAIVDGQLTTALAGWVLYTYGSGPIQGFATMLLIGIFSTLFAGLWVSRLFFDVYVGRGRSATTIGI